MNIFNNLEHIDDVWDGDTRGDKGIFDGHDDYTGRLDRFSDREVSYVVLDTLQTLRKDIKSHIKSTDEEIKQLQRDNARLRLQISTLSKQTPSGFAQFRLFPPEIRRMIWREALPSRVVTIEVRSKGGKISYAFSHKLQAPSTAHVCRESREEALRTGRLCALENDNPIYIRRWPPVPPVPGLTRDTSFRVTDREWSWFDSSRDTLMLTGSWNLLHENHLIPPPTDARQPIRGLLDFTRSAKSVTLDGDYSIDHWNLFNPRQFASLESVSILKKELQIARRRDPALEAHFFGEDPKAVLLVVDKMAKQDIPPTLKPPFSKWFTLDDFGHDTNWPRCCSETKATLEGMWLQKQFEWHPWTVSDARHLLHDAEKWMETMKGPEFGLATMICLSQSDIGYGQSVFALRDEDRI